VQVSINSLTIADLTHGGTLAPAAYHYEPATNTAVFELPATTPDAEYRATLSASGGATSHSFDFFVLAADANRDRKVDQIDLGILSLNWQQTGRTFSLGNFDYSPGGKVDVNDLNILAAHWKQSLAAPVLSPAPQPVRSPVRRLGSRMIDEIEAASASIGG
jgi:hypothetical protein